MSYNKVILVLSLCYFNISNLLFSQKLMHKLLPVVFVILFSSTNCQLIPWLLLCRGCYYFKFLYYYLCCCCFVGVMHIGMGDAILELCTA